MQNVTEYFYTVVLLLSTSSTTRSRNVLKVFQNLNLKLMFAWTWDELLAHSLHLVSSFS